MKYIVKVGGRECTVDVDGGTVSVDGVVVTTTLTQIGSTPEYRLELDGLARRLAVDSFGQDSWSLVLDGAVHEVGILDERTRHIRSLAGAAAGSAGSATVKAPMPGLFVKRLVEVGAVVEAGQGLVVLEAMKMENELRAPLAGRVLAIHGEPGQAIEKGRPLVDLGPVGE